MTSYSSRLRQLDSMIESQWNDTVDEMNRRRTARLEYDALTHDLIASSSTFTPRSSTPKSMQPISPTRRNILQLSSSRSLRPSSQNISPSENELNHALQQVNDAFDRVTPSLRSRQQSQEQQQQQSTQSSQPKHLHHQYHQSQHQHRPHNLSQSTVNSFSTATLDFPTVSVAQLSASSTPAEPNTTRQDLQIRLNTPQENHSHHRQRRVISQTAPLSSAPTTGTRSSASASSEYLYGTLSDDQIYNVASAAAEAAIKHTPDFDKSQTDVVFRAAIAAAAAAASTAAAAILLASSRGSVSSGVRSRRDVASTSSNGMSNGRSSNSNTNSTIHQSSNERVRAGEYIVTPGHMNSTNSTNSKNSTSNTSNTRNSINNTSSTNSSGPEPQPAPPLPHTATPQLSPPRSKKNKVGNEIYSNQNSGRKENINSPRYRSVASARVVHRPNNVHSSRETTGAKYASAAAQYAAERARESAGRRNGGSNGGSNGRSRSPRLTSSAKKIQSNISTRKKTFKQSTPSSPKKDVLETNTFKKSRSTARSISKPRATTFSTTKTSLSPSPNRKVPHTGGGLIHARSPFFSSTGLLTYERDRVSIGHDGKIQGAATLHNATTSSTSRSSLSPTPLSPPSRSSTVNGFSNRTITTSSNDAFHSSNSSLSNSSSNRLLVRVESSLVPPLRQPQPSSAPRPKSPGRRRGRGNNNSNSNSNSNNSSSRMGTNTNTNMNMNMNTTSSLSSPSVLSSSKTSITDSRRSLNIGTTGRPSIGGASGGLPGRLSGQLRSSPLSGKKKNRMERGASSMFSPRSTPPPRPLSSSPGVRSPTSPHNNLSSPNNSPSLNLDQLESVEPEWIRKNKTPAYRSPMYDEYARKSGQSQSKVEDDLNDNGENGSTNNPSNESPSSVRVKQVRNNEESSSGGGGGNSTPVMTTGGRSRVVSTAMKQSIWEAEFAGTDK